MTRIHDQRQFKALVLERFDDLSRQQQLVAEYLLEHLEETPFLSVPELAHRAHTSEATVVRFAQSLGFSGFGRLKASLLEVLRERVVAPRERGAAPGGEDVSREDTPDAVARLEMGNIERSMADLDRETFRRVATTIFKADHVYTFGLGVSAHMAGLLGYLLTQIGLRSTTMSAAYSSPLEQLIPLRPTDLLVVFSFPPYSKSSVELVQCAEEAGVPTLVITDRPTAPAATASRLALTVRSDNMMFTNAFSAISVLLNSLATEIALRHREQATDAVSRISRLLAEDPNLIEGSR